MGPKRGKRPLAWRNQIALRKRPAYLFDLVFTKKKEEGRGEGGKEEDGTRIFLHIWFVWCGLGNSAARTHGRYSMKQRGEKLGEGQRKQQEERKENLKKGETKREHDKGSDGDKLHKRKSKNEGALQKQSKGRDMKHNKNQCRHKKMRHD